MLRFGRNKAGRQNNKPDQGGRGRNKGGAYGLGGFCICVKCGTKVPHQQGVKCTTLKCPNCGHVMVREELLDEKRSKEKE